MEAARLLAWKGLAGLLIVDESGSPHWLCWWAHKWLGMALPTSDAENLTLVRLVDEAAARMFVGTGLRTVPPLQPDH